MEHKEFKRINKNANTVVLFIHGIVGTPNHFNEFVSLVPNTFSVYNMLLDGHGKGVKDFSKTSMKKWETQVADVVDELCLTHEKIYIVAHSLGTLLAIEQAVKNPKIQKMFLLASPLSLFLKPKMTINSLKVYFDKISPSDRQALAAKNCYGIEKDKNPFHYIGWIPRFFELFSKIRKTRSMINLINAECAVFQSSKDELVSKRSVKYFAQNPNVSVKWLEKSGHYYYDEGDKNLLLAEFSKMLTQ
ncbi:MAG: hypothetical protein E7537_05185 [Ruminococcaceae bacterium]|nr:hypothetical protein [Oscillospiraceae bacterium]